MVAVLWEGMRGWRATTSGVVPQMVMVILHYVLIVLVPLDVGCWIYLIVRRRRRAVREGRVGAAEQAAKKLLLTYLDRNQKKYYETSGGFWVKSKLYRDSWWWLSTYELPQLWQANKYNRQKWGTLCIHLYGVPRADELLAFKFSIEADEAKFMATGNFQGY